MANFLKPSLPLFDLFSCPFVMFNVWVKDMFMVSRDNNFLNALKLFQNQLEFLQFLLFTIFSKISCMDKNIGLRTGFDVRKRDKTMSVWYCKYFYLLRFHLAKIIILWEIIILKDFWLKMYSFRKNYAWKRWKITNYP